MITPRVSRPVKSAGEEGLEEITVNVQKLPVPYFTETLTVSRPRFPWSAIAVLAIGILAMTRGRKRG